jgi:NAD(P)H-dependent FMN reductase
MTIEGEPVHIQIIVGSTRNGRRSRVVADWVYQQLVSNKNFSLEIVDLKDWHLPMFELESAPMRTEHKDPLQKKWAEKISSADGYIFISPEYNHSFTPSLKNALDYLYHEWSRKPATFVSFGEVGGARSIEQLRLVLIELKMAPLKEALHIFDLRNKLDVSGFHASEQDKEYLQAAVQELIWWVKALKEARSKKV